MHVQAYHTRGFDHITLVVLGGVGWGVTRWKTRPHQANPCISRSVRRRYGLLNAKLAPQQAWFDCHGLLADERTPGCPVNGQWLTCGEGYTSTCINVGTLPSSKGRLCIYGIFTDRTPATPLDYLFLPQKESLFRKKYRLQVFHKLYEVCYAGTVFKFVKELSRDK